MASQLNVRPAHRRPRRAPRWAFLRVALAIALAVLMLPFLGASAAAEEGLDEPAQTAEALQAGSEEVLEPESPPAEKQAEPPAEKQAETPQPPADEPQAEESQPEKSPGATSGSTREGNLLAAVDDTVEPLVVALADNTTSGTGTLDKWEQCENGAAGAPYSPSDPTGTGCSWITGNLTLNANNYAEGDYVLRRARLTGLNAGLNEYVMNYDVRVSGKWAYDELYLPGVIAVGATTVPTTVTIIPGSGTTTRTDVARIVFDAPTAGDYTVYIPVHIASELEYGPGMGAGSLPGSNYHTRAVSLNGRGLGNRDLQMQSNAVKAGSVTVTKVATPADGTDFSFRLTGGGEAAEFLLDVDDDPTNPSSVTYRIAPGAVTATETVLPAGWSLENLVCTGTTADIDLTARSAAFTLQHKDDVTCTFTNSKIRYTDLIVSKTATPSYDRDYDWAVDKSVDKDKQKIAEGSTAKFDYSVVVTPSAPKDSSFKVSGEITVQNPNSVPITGVDVTDAVGATSCTVTGGKDATIPANGSKKFAYTCSLPGATASTKGTNTATATWDASSWFGTSGSAEGSKAFDFAAATPSVTDGSVTVTDSQYDLSEGGTKSTVVQAEDGQKTFTYSMVRGGTAGECTTYPNTATITEPDGGKLSDSQSVELCVGKDLAVTKNVVLKYDRSYAWAIDKSVDKTAKEIDPATGKATFTYKVTVEAKPYTDSSWAMSGKITVTNPNKWQDVTLSSIKDVVDVGGGAVCTVQQGADLKIPKSSSRDFTYACTFTSQPRYTGTNTATVEWDKAAYATPSGSASGTAAVAADKDSETSINKTVRVLDDKTTPGAAIELGQVTWSEGLKKEFTYSLELAGSPGTCVDHTNKAWIKETGQWDSQKVSVCAPAALSAEKTVTATYDRVYLWDIDKLADKTRVEVSEGAQATFSYTVKAMADGYRDRGHKIHGTIKVSNPNDYKSVVVDITDSIDLAGVVCTVLDGSGVVVPKSGSVVRSYTCVVPKVPEADYAKGVNKATVTWDGGKATATAPVKFALDQKIDDVVDVYDDKVTLGSAPALLGKAKWADGSTTFAYPLSMGGDAGVCTDYTNTATIDVTASDHGLKQLGLDKDDPSASETVTVCVEAPLTASKTASASYDRTYLWDISKVADSDRVDTLEGEPGTVEYTVGVTPDGYVDSGWEMSGAVVVHNPNLYKGVTVSLTDVPDLGDGAACVFDETGDLVVGAGATRTFTFTCSFEQRPAYDGTNTVHVDWGTGKVSAITDVAFELDEATDETVTVTDDLYGGELGQVTWNADGTTTDLEYALEVEGPVDACETVTNTATIVETGQEAQAEVLVCGPEILPTEEEVPAPRPPAILPETGAPYAVGLWTWTGGLMVALGAALLTWRRRYVS
jgi:large repetitive protein